MHKPLRTALTAGSAALILAGAAFAAPPTGFSYDVWTVTAGTVGGTTCPATWTCGTAMTGTGFYQRQVKDGSGNKYFQTIVAPDTETAATGGAAHTALSFSDENFVKIGATGLADKQHVRDNKVTSADTVFNGNVTVDSGWATAVAGGVISISMDLTVDDGTQNTLYNGFTLDQQGASGATGKKIKVTQAIMLDADAATGNNTGDDLQKFIMSQASGTLNGAAHVLGSPVLLPDAVAGDKDVAWAGTDNVKMVWAGQQMAKSGGESFRYQLYDNLTSAASDSISRYELGATTLPWTNVNPFGAVAPTMTVGP